MFGNQRPVWANPEQSVGERCEKKFGNQDCYEATGPVCDVFLPIARNIKNLLDKHQEDLVRGEQKPKSIAFAIFMVGTEPSQTQPTIVFASKSKRQRKRAKALVESHELLADHPSIQMKTFDRLPALPRGDTQAFEWPESGNASSGPSKETSPVQNSDLNRRHLLSFDGGGIRGYSSLLILKALMEHIAKVEALLSNQQDEKPPTLKGDTFSGGGLLCIGKETYSLSALHPYIDLEAEEDGQDALQSDNSDFDSDSDDDSNDVALRRGPSASPSHGYSSSAIATLESGLDYKISHVNGPSQTRWNSIKLDEEPSKVITPHVIALEAEERNVIVNTQTTGPVKGRLMRAPRYIKMAGWSTFQEMWVVRMSRDAIPGDCGAWVIEDTDDRNCKFFGHVVAGQPGSFEAYILPAIQTFDDIERQYGIRPHLPDWEENTTASWSSNMNLSFISHSQSDSFKTTQFLPVNYFEYICGTSTGGLVAIMLSRLRMSVDDCLTEYETLSEQVLGKPRYFSMRGPVPWFRAKYSAANLENAVKMMVQRKQQHERDRPPSSYGSGFFSPSDSCRTIVSSVRANLDTGVQQPVMFRNYSRRLSLRSESSSKIGSNYSRLSDNWSDLWSLSTKSSSSSWDGDDAPAMSISPKPYHGMAIWQVARATSAAPTYFAPFVFQDSQFVDGGLMYNNPTELAYEEMREIDSNSPSPFVISIGTGRNDTSNFSRPRVRAGRLRLSLQRFLNPSDKLIRDSELVHSEMENLSLKGKLQYHRFNAGGMGDFKLDEWKPATSKRLGTLGTIRQHTEKYLTQPAVQEELAKVADYLVRRRRLRVRGQHRWPLKPPVERPSVSTAAMSQTHGTAVSSDATYGGTAVKYCKRGA